MKHFRTLNVCKVGDWEEVRVKGAFVIPSQNDCMTLKSRHQFELQVTGPRQKVFIGLHQEDERIEYQSERKPFMNISLAVMRRQYKTGLYEVYKVREFCSER